VDGVLIDEEWPHGALYQFCSPFLLGAGYSADGKLDSGFTGEIDLIVTDRIVDVCIDNRRTFIARRNDLGGNRLFFFAKRGGVLFEQIEIRPLLDE
jgi:hypothetical protein